MIFRRFATADCLSGILSALSHLRLVNRWPWIKKSKFLWHMAVNLLESLMILEVRAPRCFKVPSECGNTAKQALKPEDVVVVMVGGLLLLIG